MPNILRNASGDLIAKRTLQRSPTYLNVSKNILARQSIFRNLDCNIDHKIKKAPSILTQQQIKQSSIYQKLMLRIQRVRQRQQQQKIQHQRRMKQLEEQIRETKQSIKQDKLDIWEVRNQTFELEEMFQQQMEEYEYLCHVLQEQMQHHGLHQFMGGEEYNGQGQGEGYYDQQDEQEEAYQTNQDMQQGSTNRDPPSQQRDSFSKPTCSIKFMITERSITTPDLSNIQIHSGRQPFSNHTHENYTHNCMHQQSQQELKNKRILSFKKSSHIFTHQG